MHSPHKQTQRCKTILITNDEDTLTLINSLTPFFAYLTSTTTQDPISRKIYSNAPPSLGPRMTGGFYHHSDFRYHLRMALPLFHRFPPLSDG